MYAQILLYHYSIASGDGGGGGTAKEGEE